MKKAALLCTLLGAVFFGGCATDESGTVDTTESTAPAADDAAVDMTTTGTAQ